MRKVTKQIKAAFEAGKSKTIGNTHTDGTTVYLHGNAIVQRREDGIYASLAGWNTPTTRERVNGITGSSLTQKDFEPYLNGKPCSAIEWYKIS